MPKVACHSAPPRNRLVFRKVTWRVMPTLWNGTALLRPDAGRRTRRDSMTTVLCNAGPLIALGKLNRLEWLAELYGQVQLPRAVYDEAVTQGLALGAPDACRSNCSGRLKRPIARVAAAILAAFRPPVILDPGETEVLALAWTFLMCWCCWTMKRRAPRPRV